MLRETIGAAIADSSRPVLRQAGRRELAGEGPRALPVGPPTTIVYDHIDKHWFLIGHVWLKWLETANLAG